MPGAGVPKVEGIGAKNQNTELLQLPHFIIQLRNRETTQEAARHEEQNC